MTRYFFAHPCHEPRSSSSMSSSSSLSTGMPPRSIARSAVRRQAVSMGVTVSGVLSRREENTATCPPLSLRLYYARGALSMNCAYISSGTAEEEKCMLR